jgi:hypothetical protein
MTISTNGGTAYQREYNCYLTDCEEIGVAPLPIEEYVKLPTLRKSYKAYLKECKEIKQTPINIDEFELVHKTKYKLHDWMDELIDNKEEFEYEYYVKRCKKYSYRILNFESWKRDKQVKKAYDEYYEKCTASGKEPIAYRSFKRTYNKTNQDPEEERRRRCQLGLVEYFNDARIYADDYDSSIPSRYQPIRMSAILDKLLKNSNISDIDYVKDETHIESIRSKKAFTWVLMKRGFVLSREIDVIKKLEAAGSYFESECRSQHGVKTMKEAGAKIKDVVLNSRINYYCANEVTEHIITHSTHLGMTNDAYAFYLVLLAVSDYVFSEWVDNDIKRALDRINKHLNRQLEDLYECYEEHELDLEENENENGDE